MNAVETICIAVGSPAILAVLSHLLSMRQKRIDWEREDAVALKAAEAAKLLLAANERVARDAQEVKDQLKQIHILSNSNLTAAMKAQLEATVAKLVLMKTIRDRDKANKLEADNELAAQIEKTEVEVSELTATMNYRLQTEVANKQIADAET